MTEWQQDVAQWGNVRIEYKYRSGLRTSLAISVHPDLSVTVRAPLGVPADRIRRAVARRGAWVERARQDRELFLPKQPPRRYVSGETHRYLGRQYRLKVRPGQDESVKCLRGYLWVTVAGEREDPERVRRLLDGWYAGRAQAILQERTKICAERATLFGITSPAPTMRRMTSRWGSCSARGRITLNIDLVKAPTECIDYVILHELCHLKYRHHGPDYWSLLGRLIPDYRAVRERLNRLAAQ